MTSFTDSLGRSWTLTVNVNTLRRVSALCDVVLTDIVTIEDGKAKTDLLEKLANDPCLLVDVLFAAVKTEADARGVTDEDFGSSMVGDTLENAVNALLDEVINFFPSAKRKVLQRIVEASRRFAKKNEETLNNILKSNLIEDAVEEVLEASTN